MLCVDWDVGIYRRIVLLQPSALYSHVCSFRMTSKTATNQNGHVIVVIGEHVNKYLSLNKLGIIKSRTETMPKVGFKRNALH